MPKERKTIYEAQREVSESFDALLRELVRSMHIVQLLNWFTVFAVRLERLSPRNKRR